MQLSHCIGKDMTDIWHTGQSVYQLMIRADQEYLIKEQHNKIA